MLAKISNSRISLREKVAVMRRDWRGMHCGRTGQKESRCEWKQYMESAEKSSVAKSSKGHRFIRVKKRRWKERKRRVTGAVWEPCNLACHFPHSCSILLLDLSISEFLRSSKSSLFHLSWTHYGCATSQHEGLLRELHTRHHKHGLVPSEGTQYFLK